MRTALAIALVLAGCVDEGPVRDGDPRGVFELDEVRSMTLPKTVAGMDSDGAGGLWVIYEGETALVHLDPQGNTLATVPFETSFTFVWTPIEGLALDGDRVWVSYDGVYMLRAYDVVTGELRGSFASETGLADVDVFGDELRYSVVWDTLVGLDMMRGGERWRRPYDDNCCGSQRGIASMTDDLAFVAKLTERVFLVDRKVGVIGSGVHTFDTNGWFDIEHSHDLAWDGQYLLMQQENEIRWFEPLF
ncbi:MAG: hypothetical protein ACKV2T_29125 [Kofleriaceae bacterium]